MLLEMGIGVAVEVPFAGESRQRAKMARVMTSLWRGRLEVRGVFFGGWVWQKSSTMT